MKLILIILLAAAPLVMVGCDGTGLPNDVADQQEKARLNRPIPAATDLPPGLSNDLPATQPMVAQ
jgi:hypothetical protein